MKLTEYDSYKLYKKYKQKYKLLQRQMDGGSPSTSKKPVKDYRKSKTTDKYIVSFDGSEFDPCSLNDSTAVRDPIAQRLYNQGRGPKNSRQKKAIRDGVSNDCYKLRQLADLESQRGDARKQADDDMAKAQQELDVAKSIDKKAKHKMCLFDCQEICKSKCDPLLR